MRSEDRNKIKGVSWLVRDKTRFLLAVMTELAGSAHISFEGKLSELKLHELAGASEDETNVLKRNTTWPRQDFVVVSMEPSTEDAIIAAIGGTIPRTVLHIQMEKKGRLAFGTYDSFHPECFFIGSELSSGFIETSCLTESSCRAKLGEVVEAAETADLSTSLRSGRDDKSWVMVWTTSYSRVAS